MYHGQVVDNENGMNGEGGWAKKRVNVRWQLIMTAGGIEQRVTVGSRMGEAAAQ